MTDTLLTLTSSGLYCELGDFFIDPWKPVSKAVITHAHADHARTGSDRYLCAEPGAAVLQTRMGSDAVIDSLPYGVAQTVGAVRVTLLPAGHILGSAQVKVEHRGYSIVVSGDYKRQSDPTCQAFEPVRCNTFVTESTFGLPIFSWPEPIQAISQINDWWRSNQEQGKASLLLAYSLGKAQRLLASVDRRIGPIFTHGAIEKLTEVYRHCGIHMPDTTYVAEAEPRTDWSRALILAPPAALGTPWTRRFGRMSSGMASGWMQVRGNRRRRAMDRGFIVSDHIDWSALMMTLEETEAEQVWVTHGYSDILVRHLQESGQDARVLETEFSGDQAVEEDHAESKISSDVDSKGSVSSIDVEVTEMPASQEPPDA